MSENEGPGSIVSIKKPIPKDTTKPNIFVRGFRSIFGYRKTSLSFFLFITSVLVYGLTVYDNSLELSIGLPKTKEEQQVLELSWSSLQVLGKYKHPYGSEGNEFVHSFLETEISAIVKDIPYIEYDNDLNNTNFLFSKDAYDSLSYYESNNLLVRINGTDSDLPGLLLSAHYDSVPSSFGITDDGAGIASLLGALDYFSKSQPVRTIIFNFNNNEEFGLYGAQTFFNHPYSKGVKYFINLEGTGQGGKAILFRGTDYGITKYYNSVRYPYASSLFQQAFNGRLVHSETDYKVYYQNGLRGIDIAFFKPRDIYHTGQDNIRHTSKLALWHMLSSTLDYVSTISSQPLDIDEDSDELEYASFFSFLNFFSIINVPKLVIYNIILLVIVPVVSVILLMIIFGYKQNWRLGFINSVKFPISLLISIFVLNFITRIISTINEFLPNSNPNNLVAFSAAVFLLTNYFILNGINLLFRNYKIIQHDEKLIVTLQISFIYWILLIMVTVGLANNKKGNDHTGQGLLTVLFAIQSLASIWGLLGWCLRPSKQDLEYELAQADYQPLLVQQGTTGSNYGANQGTNEGTNEPDSDTTSLISIDSYTARKKLSLIAKTFGYDWSIQYLLLVPIPLLVFYNNGYLILQGLNKSIQESLGSEALIYNLIQVIAVSLIIPIYPFIFKINRLLVLVTLLFIGQGLFTVFFSQPFDINNPMKLRFVQSANITESVSDSYVKVNGRFGIGYEDILVDMPSFKASGEPLICNFLEDGMQQCKYKSELMPDLVKAKDFRDYLSIDILKNSSSNDYPYGLLTGEIKINAINSSMCSIKFNSAKTKDFPVKTVIKYNELTNSTNQVSIPEGFSIDKNGNYIYKDLDGIPSWSLWKLDSKPFHIGFQWLPNLIDNGSNTLKVDITCFWSDLGDEDQLVPAYKELVHYSPKYVSWANLYSGMVSVSSSIEV